jgi:L-fuculose-phosphate aldolase
MNTKKIRKALLDACLQLAGQGFLAGTGGNLAVRAGDGFFAVTPSGRDYYSMSPDDLCVLCLETLVQVEGPYPPSVEAGLHARVFRRRPDAGASVHTHQPLASAAALTGCMVNVESLEDRAHLGPHLAAVPYAPSGTFLLARALDRRIWPGLNGYLLQNHGLVCVGRDLEQAVTNTARAERACAAFLRGGILGLGAQSPAAEFALSHI